MDGIDSDHLKLTDFVDLSVLQEIQDSFAAVANVKATITDASGKTLTQPAPTRDFLVRQDAIAASEQSDSGVQRDGKEYVAPIVVNNQRLGTIRMIGSRAKPASVQFLHLMANAIARLCYQEYQLRQRMNELTAVYNVTMMLADARSLESVLQRTVELVAEVMHTRSVSLRLLDRERDELVIKSVHNLSKEYLQKGVIRLSQAKIDQEALSTTGFSYVKNLSTDPRALYPDEARREGISSMLSAGMRYKGKAVGVIRVYTDQERVFTTGEIDLLKAVASQAASAIENARLVEQSIASKALERQVQMAAQVQHRMIPQTPPKLAGIDLASVYVPCYELGGDFLDFIELPYTNLGMVVADVSGKGVPASLTMAAVRAALRAQIDNVYFLNEAIRRINTMVCRDNKLGEFVTLFYGVLDCRNRRFTYCNAGHPPGLILRDKQVIELGSNNMVLGVSPDEKFTQSLIDLKSGDILMLYTDGLADAMNADHKVFGKQRVMEVFSRGGATADEVAQNILAEINKHVGSARRTDDITMIVAKLE